MSEADFGQHLRRVANQVGLGLDSKQLALLQDHYSKLQHWNRRINLTAIRGPRENAERHFGESLFLSRELGESPVAVLDVGSGAGFPGIPTAVVHPATQMTLLEPVGKKFAFLKEVSRSLSNVSVLQARLDAVEGLFEWATVRGVSVAPILKDLGAKARRVALLTTAEVASALVEDTSVDWTKAVPLPWGSQRVLLLGKFSSKNPRSTWNL